MERIKEALRGGLPCNSKGYLESYQENIFQGYMPDRFRNMFMKDLEANYVQKPKRFIPRLC